MQLWQSLFIDADYEVTQLPSYEEKSASNPFVTFAAIPLVSRYKFMLDEAQFSIDLFIKGPVCRGESALSSIDDNFWVFFVDPENPMVQAQGKSLVGKAQILELPASQEKTLTPLLRWRELRKQQLNYLTAKDQQLSEGLGASGAVNLDLIWTGNGDNQNAALTVYRHFDSASVKKGLLGQAPIK